MAIVIVETFDDRESKRKRIFDSEGGEIRLHIDKYGGLKVLTCDNFCKTCGGSGGARYHYAQDESVGC